MSNHAHYDGDGNIIIDDMQEVRTSRHQHVCAKEEEKEMPKEEMLAEEKTSPIRHFQASPSSLVKNMTAFWRVLRSPVTISRSSHYGTKAKPRSRMYYFAIDSLRFGGTFAAIFGALFVIINYQSFWNIAKAELALKQDLKTVQGLSTLTNPEKAEAMSATEFSIVSRAEAEGNMISFLPPVGPPENRLIIPKLGQNIPIVIPPIDSLLTENWSQFEKDVQSSLRGGVVHYPGTARPGQAGNFFVTGHSSYYPWDSGQYKDVFSRLGELSIGDTYSVYYGGDLHTYRITKIFEVKPNNTDVLDQPTDKRMATLMTCTPIGTTLRRLIVQADEMDPLTGMTLKVGEYAKEQPSLPQVEMLPI